MNLAVPFLDLEAHHAPLREEIAAAIDRVVDSSAFAGGPFVTRFEDEFARFCGTEHAIGVSSGTDALWLAMHALGIGPGDEVITVPMTFIATVEAISRTGARPVFVDIEKSSYTMDPTALGRALTPRTRAILPVHLFGQMAAMPEILSFADRHGLAVVEDAAQAHGAECAGGHAGAMGQAGCFSFYPGKNLGALGDAGAVITQDAQTAERIRALRDHGQNRKYRHEEIGWNCRMDGIQAAVLSVKLRHLARNNGLRRQHARRYAAAFADVPGLEIPATLAGNVHAHHHYVVRVPDRDDFMETLSRRGVGCAIHYPIPVHLQPAYAHLGLGPGSFPIAEHFAGEFVSLPVYPELTDRQIDTVVNAVLEAMHAEPALA
jgi:dTDP-4-amino-4,6-dideoxygalactose transaminase